MEDGTSKSPRHTGEPIRPPRVGRPQTCEIRDLLDRLADKWSLLVVELLGRRHAAVHRAQPRDRRHQPAHAHPDPAPPGRDGLVTRTVHPVVPPRVDYELTPLGAGLLDAVAPLVSWTRAHRDEISVARRDYDHRDTA